VAFYFVLCFKGPSGLLLVAAGCSVRHDCDMRDESLLLGEPTLRDINAALERLMEQARQRRHRYRVQQRSRTAATITKSQEIAEVLCLWQAALPSCFPTRSFLTGRGRVSLVGSPASMGLVARSSINF
jgi:hypothetical protein